jgi:anhydro-N-acetylmuramic acid kinase
MSGTSMDGVDASIIRSDGESNYEPIFDKYFEYDGVIYSNLLNLRDKINSIKIYKIILIKLTSLKEKLPYFMQKLAKKL